MASGVHMIVLVGWIIALLVIYHKIFTVYYFDLGQGILKELSVSFILGLIMTALTFYLWWLTAIIIIMAGLSFKKKFSSNVPVIVAIVLAIFVAFLGISTRSETDNGGTIEARIKETTAKEVVKVLVQVEASGYVENISGSSKYAEISDSGLFI